MLLQASDISTIHSFCKRLITENFYKLSLDPTFRVIDGDEQKLLKAEVLEETIDWAWKQENIQRDLKQLLYRRDLRTGDGFITKVIELSDFLDSVISRDNWYERAIHLTQISNPIDSEPGQKQIEIIKEKTAHILSQLRWLLHLAFSQNAETSWLEKYNR